MAMKMRKIVIVGCGPGSPDYLTPSAKKAIRRAQVVFGAKRLLETFAPPGAERVVVGADILGALDGIAARVAQQNVVVLVTGDPGMCSLAQPILKRFGREACEVIPGISSVQVAFARIGMDWRDARIVHAHGRVPEVSPASLRGVEKIAVLGGERESLAWTADLALTLGDAYRIFVCEDLTLGGERVREVGAATLRRLRVSSRTIVLVVKMGNG